jgi:hypothetical protein
MDSLKIVPYAKSIELSSFSELRELVFMSASILHEASIHPIKVKDIPLNICNTISLNIQGLEFFPLSVKKKILGILSPVSVA